MDMAMEEKKEADGGSSIPEGCYLCFESNSGGRLTLLYTKSEIPQNAVGFFCPGQGHSIQGFKFKQNGGRVEVIKGIAGGDQNRRKYYSGWCQFIKTAKAMNGFCIKFPNPKQGVEVTLYFFREKTSDHPLVEVNLDEGLTNISQFDAVAVLPKHNSTFRGIKRIQLNTFLEMANIQGAATTLN